MISKGHFRISKYILKFKLTVNHSIPPDMLESEQRVDKSLFKKINLFTVLIG